MKRVLNYLRLVRQTSQMPEYLGIRRQLFEMLVVFFLRRVGPGCYLMAEMGKKQYDWRYKLGFLNGRQYVRRINEINDPKYYPATFNKFIEKSLLSQNAIPTPRMLGLLSPTTGRTCNGKDLKTAEDLSVLIEDEGVRKLCFKLTSGQGGEGFKAAEIVREGSVLTLRDMEKQESLSVEAYLSMLDFPSNDIYLVEEYFEQHSELKRFNASSLNTLRIMVYQPIGGKVECLGVFLRIGRQGAIVDNGSAGGICAKVDILTGKLYPATSVFSRAHYFKHHPDTGVPIENVTVPYLLEAIELAMESIQVFPGINYAGVDVAIGKDGPIVIELNARADYVDFSILNEPSMYALK